MENVVENGNNQTEKNRPPLDVVVLKDCNENVDKKRSVVIPGEVIVKIGESVVWKNHTKDKILIFFPDNRIFGTHLTNINGAQNEELTVSKDIEPGRYPYSVYTKESEDFAEGSYYPIMIVER
jgi:hypothetical protein